MSNKYIFIILIILIFIISFIFAYNIVILMLLISYSTRLGFTNQIKMTIKLVNFSYRLRFI